jgi:hypothetical protein
MSAGVSVSLSLLFIFCPLSPRTQQPCAGEDARYAYRLVCDMVTDQMNRYGAEVILVAISHEKSLSGFFGVALRLPIPRLS